MTHDRVPNIGSLCFFISMQYFAANLIIITLCNTIFVPGFQVLYFNCLCLKPMKKQLHFMNTAQKNFVFIVTEHRNLYIFVHAVR